MSSSSQTKYRIVLLAPEQKSVCVTVEFGEGLYEREQDEETLPCEPTCIEGFAPPKLLTDIATAKF